MLLENRQITDPVPDKLRPDQRPAGMPLLPIRREDAVAQKVLPILMERPTLAIVLELRRQDGLDVLRLGGEDEALRADLRLDRVRRPGRSEAGEEPFPELEVAVADGGADAAIGEVEACGGLCEDSEMGARGEARTEWEVYSDPGGAAAERGDPLPISDPNSVVPCRQNNSDDGDEAAKGHVPEYSV